MAENWFKLVSAYVSILKSVRKLQEAVDELPLEVREHFTMQPSSSQAKEPSALVPFKSEIKKSNVCLANTRRRGFLRMLKVKRQHLH